MKKSIGWLVVTIFGFGAPVFADSTGVITFEDDTNVVRPVNPKVRLTFKTLVTKKGAYISTVNWSLVTGPTS
ncbi:hypothetical protein RAK27_14545 [Carnobacterium maltaromaticum]|uniref:WxL domain-containing protein n=1 Tax=Carnobacterium maltaromaticum TaxID=2751 RepID=A0AAW9JW81_CARML|nr:hypothetical protein [Carnobacterium maltaromaticum]MDZ5759878.1 hypothetical protein [Carnobacterium maltaromaticum]